MNISKNPDVIITIKISLAQEEITIPITLMLFFLHPQGNKYLKCMSLSVRWLVCAKFLHELSVITYWI